MMVPSFFSIEQFLALHSSYADQINNDALRFADRVCFIPSGSTISLDQQLGFGNYTLIVVECDANFFLTLADDEGHEKTIVLHVGSRSNVYVDFAFIAGGSYIIKLYAYGDESDITIRGIYLTDQQQELHLKTLQYHQGKRAQSALRIHGVATDQSRVHYDGLIVIDKEATGTNAVQENKNIVLSARAHVVSIPAIEVLTNDVFCGHGSAISYLDEMHLFYLQSRGISRSEAHYLIINAFLEDSFKGSLYPNREIINLKANKMSSF